MPSPITCPDAHEYERLRRGEMSLPEVEQLAQHIEKCGRCADQMQSLPIDDTLIESLRVRSTVTDPKEKDRVSDLVARLKQFRLPANPAVEATAAESPAVPALTPVDQTCEVYDFLAPAQGAGEIGRLGPYRVLKVLGTGGMGVVFKAEDVKLKRLVALKAMRPAIAASAAAGQRFQREAEATAAIKHDHIVTIYQVGEDRGVPFLAMEFLEGMALDDWLKKGRKPTLTQAARIGRQIALGLAEAHACGLIHRDIKPANVWLDSRHQGRVKLLDFGLARGGADDDHQLTQSGAIVGTPAYMAPEQARGEKVDHRVDLFSLGVVLYRLTTGQLPFRGDNTMSVLTSLAMDTPKAPREINPNIPPRMAALIERLLSKDRAQRPATAKEVAVELAVIEREAAPTQTANGRREPAGTASTSRLTPAVRRMVAAASVFLLLGGALAAIVIHIKTPNGETKEMRFPDGTVVEVGQEKDAPFVPKGAGALDRLDPAKIPAIERFADMPKELVAVLGENRGGNNGMVGKIALSPDGKLAVSSSARDLRLWDVATMRERAVLAGEDDNKSAHVVAFAPDGKTLASTFHKNSTEFIRLWDITTSAPKEKGRFKHPSIISSLAFSADSRRLLTGSRDQIARLWDVPSSKELKRFEGHKDAIWQVALSADGRRALSGDGQGILHLWDVDTGKELHHLETKGHECRGLAFSPDGKRALSGSNVGPAKLWDVETGKLLVTYQDAKSTLGVAFTPDGRRALLGASGYSTPELRLLDLESGEVVRRFEGSTFAALSADGHRALANDGNGVRLWDVDSGKELLPRTGHTGRVTCVAFAPDGKSLASGSTDRTVRLWNLTGVAPRERLFLPSEPNKDSWGISVAFSPDGRTLAAGFAPNDAIALWNLTGTEAKPRTKLRWPGWGAWVTFAADGSLVGWEHYSQQRDVLLWSVSGDEPAERVRLKRPIHADPHSGVIQGLSISADSKTVALGVWEGNVELWDVSGKEPKKTSDLKAHKQSPLVAFAPDGKMLASFGRDGSKVAVGEELAVKLWDLSVQPPKQLGRLGSEKFPNIDDYVKYENVRFAPDGKTLVTQNAAGHFTLWDVAARKKLRSWQLPAECSPFAFAPDGRHLAVGSKKGAIFILRLDLAKP